MIALALLMAGSMAVPGMGVSRLPQLSVPRVVVEASMEGLPAAEIRSLVTVPLEDALASVRGLVSSSSLSRDGVALITLDFRWGEDALRAAARVRELADAAWPSLPEGAAKPVVLPYDPSAQTLMVVGFSATDGTLAHARRFAEYEGRAAFRRASGIGAVVMAGGMERELAVELDMYRCLALGMTVSDCAALLSGECADLPAGSVAERDIELVALLRGRPDSIDELANMILPGPRGPFRLADVAAVYERDASRSSVFVANGREQVALCLYARPGGDPVAAARQARKAVDELRIQAGSAVQIEILEDASGPVASSIRDLAIAAALGALAVVLVLFLVFRNLRFGLLVSLSIPLSVAFCLLSLRLLGRSLNSMSLGGIGLAIGMISDNAVVVLSALAAADRGRTDKPQAQACAQAVASVLSGTLGSTVTTLVVFVPVFFLPGAIGAIFGDLAVSVMAGNLAGWLIAVLMVPGFYRLLWVPRRMEPSARLETSYRRKLAYSLRHPIKTLFGAFALSLLGIFLVLTRPLEFLPAEKATELRLTFDFRAASSADGMASDAVALSSALAGLDCVQAVYGYAGSEPEDLGRRADQDYRAETLVLSCRLKKGWTAAKAGTAIEQAAGLVLGGKAFIGLEVPADPAAKLLSLEGGRYVLARAGTPKEVFALALSAQLELARLSTTAMQHSSLKPSDMRPSIMVARDRERGASLQLSSAESARVLRAATEGAVPVSLEFGGHTMPIRVFASEFSSASGTPASAVGLGHVLAAVPLALSDYAPVYAGTLASFSMIESESVLYRVDRADALLLEATAAPGSEAALDRYIRAVLDDSPGLSMAGESAFRTYGMAMVSALGLVIALLYLTLGAQFESFLLPLPIMATIVLAMAGVGPALCLAGLSLDSGSIMGMVVLFGVVVNNAILLGENSSLCRNRGLTLAQSVYRGASERVRPLVATSLTTLVALLPLCLMPSGAAQKSMSVAMLGGMAASTALTLFVAPVFFARLGADCSAGSRL